MESYFKDSLSVILNGKGERLKPNSTQAKDLNDELVNIYDNGHKQGDSTTLRRLDEHLRWRKGFLYTVSGFPGAGKSTFVNYLLILKAIEYKSKIAIYSPESYPIEDLIEELIVQFSKKNLSPDFGNQMSVEERNITIDFIHNHFFFVDFKDIPTQEDVFNEFQRLVNDEGVDTCVVDPFNSLVEGSNSGGGGNMSIFLKGALTRAKLFAINSDVSLVLIEHPRSAGVNNANEKPKPSPFLINGGPMWWNKSDVLFTVDRDFEANNSKVDIKIWKVKKQRLMGSPGEVELEFNFKTMSYE